MGRAYAGTRCKDPHVFDQNDARVWISRCCTLETVFLQVLSIAITVERGGLAKPVAKRLDVVNGRVIRHPKRQTLRVHEVIRARSAYVGELACAVRPHEL